MLAAAEAFDFVGLPHLFEHLAVHVQTDFGALLVEFCDVERLLETGDGQTDSLRFLAKRESGVLVLALELLVECLEGEEQVVDVRPGIVFALVPAFSS